MIADTPLKVIFAGTPDFAAQHLQALIESEHQLIAVYTQPDRPAGRGKKLAPSPVKQLALSAGVPLFQPASLKSDEAQTELAALEADVMIVVAYGLILPLAVLSAPRLGCLNVHGSILPRWRGAAPIQRAIEAGDKVSGVTIMQMDEGLDTGDMLLVAETPIEATTSSADLYQSLAQLGPKALLATLDQLSAGTAIAHPQDNNLASYAHKIDKAEAEINWSAAAIDIDRKIRAFNPAPICFTWLNGERFKIHAATPIDLDPKADTKPPGTILVNDRQQLLVACGSGALALTKLQVPGKKAMSLAEFSNGYAQLCPIGSRLGDKPDAAANNSNASDSPPPQNATSHKNGAQSA